MRFDLIEAIDAAAKAEKMTRSAYVLRAIHQSLANGQKRPKKAS
jgi:uncharacterized protein (DUF1778 family)